MRLSGAWAPRPALVRVRVVVRPAARSRSRSWRAHRGLRVAAIVPRPVCADRQQGSSIRFQTPMKTLTAVRLLA